MGIDAFDVVEADLNERPEVRRLFFAQRFLSSPDFDLDSLAVLSKALGVRPEKTKTAIASNIAGAVNTPKLALTMIAHVLGKPKRGVSIRVGSLGKAPNLEDAAKLMYQPGAEVWHGPLRHFQDNPEAAWYVRPVFVKHAEFVPETNEVKKILVRWLCFARLDRQWGCVSLHWRGFTLGVPHEAKVSETQFPYWKYVPSLFVEIGKLCHCELNEVDLSKLILHSVWDQYRSDPRVVWVDNRVRAESGGVFLSAHSAGRKMAVELDTHGIRHLAQTIRVSLNDAFRRKGLPELENGAFADEVILEALIREYGTLSYEPQIDRDGKPLLEAHFYFGLRDFADSPDGFAHMMLGTSRVSDLDQLKFLLPQMSAHVAKTNADLPLTPSLFHGAGSAGKTESVASASTSIDDASGRGRDRS